MTGPAGRSGAQDHPDEDDHHRRQRRQRHEPPAPIASGASAADRSGTHLRVLAREGEISLTTRDLASALRSLLANQHVGSAGLKAIVWCLAITAASYLWASYLYNRRPVQ